MANLEVVKLLQEVPSLSAPVTLSAHEKRLERIAGRMIKRLSLDKDGTKWLKGLKDAGFDSIVTVDWALKFKYHAGISFLTVCEDSGMREDHKQTWYYYAGDIPESALDALELFNKVSCSREIYFTPHIRHPYVTIHSMEILPIRMERTLQRVDPVLIGWMESPCFTLGPSGWGIQRDSTGVIIAAWDEENEIIDYKKLGTSLLGLLG